VRDRGRAERRFDEVYRVAEHLERILAAASTWP
jgi:hypothetical protein